MLDKRITYIGCWYKIVYQVFPVATRSDTGSHNRLDLILSIVPPPYVCNGYAFLEKLRAPVIKSMHILMELTIT